MIRTLFSTFFFLLFNVGFAQNGKLLSKEPVDLSQTPVWNYISSNDSLSVDFQHLNDLDFFYITYLSDSLIVNGILIEPRKNGTYPVVIFNRGGNRDFAPLSVASMIMYTSKLAEQGYVIIGSNYRENDEFGGSEVNDVLNLTKTVEEIEKADPNSIGMFGWSRGGMMTYLALQKSDNIRTAIIGNGPTNLFDIAQLRPQMETNVFAECIPDYWKNREMELKRRSAIFWTEELDLNSSLLILCGTNDQRVNPQQADIIAHKLKEIAYDFELRKFETDHFFSDKKDELNKVVIEWFNERLKN